MASSHPRRRAAAGRRAHRRQLRSFHLAGWSASGEPVATARPAVTGIDHGLAVATATDRMGPSAPRRCAVPQLAPALFYFSPRLDLPFFFDHRGAGRSTGFHLLRRALPGGVARALPARESAPPAAPSSSAGARGHGSSRARLALVAHCARDHYDVDVHPDDISSMVGERSTGACPWCYHWPPPLRPISGRSHRPFRRCWSV